MTPLKLYRVTRDLTQAQMAEQIGISQGAYSRIESGRVEPTLAAAVKIERATGGKVTAASWVEPANEPAPASTADSAA